MAGLLRRGLTEDGHVVDVAVSGDDAVWMGQVIEYDAIVLDLMLPGLDGVGVCRRWRENGVWSPSSCSQRATVSRIASQDWTPAPTTISRNRSRSRSCSPACARSPDGEGRSVRSTSWSEDLRLDPGSTQVWRGEAVVELSTREFALLEAFMRRPGDVLSRVHLLEHAWDYAYENRSNVVDVYVRYCARRSTGRSDAGRSRPCTASATGSVRRCAMSRVPIRLRLTLAFALAMAIVLAGIGSFLVYRLGTSLDEAVNEGLQGRAEELAPRSRAPPARSDHRDARPGRRASPRCSTRTASSSGRRGRSGRRQFSRLLRRGCSRRLGRSSRSTTSPGSRTRFA